MFNLKTKDITLIATFTSILFVQEQVLSFIPNVQLTVFFIVLYNKVFGLGKTLIMVFIHTILDNLLMSSFSIIYFIPMLIGWGIIPFIICVIFKKVENPLILGLIGSLCSLVYCWMFVIANWIFTNVDVLLCLANDIVFEVILAVSSFITIMWLYKPCSKLLYKLNVNNE